MTYQFVVNTMNTTVNSMEFKEQYKVWNTVLQNLKILVITKNAYGK